MEKKKKHGKKPVQQNTGIEYALKIIRQKGVACVSVVDSCKHYSVHGDKEPEGRIFKGFHEKKKKRGRILVKLGIWENGQNSKPLKKQE